MSVIEICFFSSAAGIFLGLIYSIFKILRLSFKLKKIGTFILDILYSLLCAISVFLLILFLNNGNIRYFILNIIAVSYIIYHMTIGRLILLFFYRISEFFGK
jgi:hypothetical protein